MKVQPDFVGEETLLQHRAQELGCTVDCSPKCHPEIAGEGIEFSWACAKGHYRKQPLKRKRSKKGYLQLVEESLDRNKVLTKGMMRGFAKRQRDYMLAYMAIKDLEMERFGHNADEVLNGDVSSSLGKNITPAISETLVERLKQSITKRKLTHRNIDDQERKFIQESLNKIGLIGIKDT